MQPAKRPETERVVRLGPRRRAHERREVVDRPDPRGGQAGAEVGGDDSAHADHQVRAGDDRSGAEVVHDDRDRRAAAFQRRDRHGGPARAVGDDKVGREGLGDPPQPPSGARIERAGWLDRREAGRPIA